MVRGVQWPMPRRRSGHTTAVTIGAERFYLTANQRADGTLGEVFIHWGKHGTAGAGLMNTYALALSAGLRHQVPLAELIGPGLGQDFTPNGPTDDPEIPSARSAVDYIARRLAIDWLPYRDRAELGVYTATEQSAAAIPGLAAEGEHLRRVNPRAQRVDLVQPGLERRSLQGQVVVQHGLPQLSAFGPVHRRTARPGRARSRPARHRAGSSR